MKILYIHTYYRQRGGEDIVYENEKILMEEGGYETASVVFNNRKFAAFKFMFLFFNPLSFIKVYRKIGEFKPDIVHIHNWFFGASPSVFLAVKLRKVPLVHTMHNFRILCPSAYLYDSNGQFMDSVTKIIPFRAIKNRVYRHSFFFTFWLAACTRLHFLFRTWQSADRLISLTANARKIIFESYLHIEPNKVVVKPNFFKIDHSSPVISGNVIRNNSFLFVGRLSVEKGVEVLLSAFHKSPFSLTIIGDGPLRKEVEKSAAENGNISFIGFQKKDRIMEEMSKCSALIFPSVAYEQFGLTIIEAFSCGTPVIASDSGSPAELISEGINGLHFKTGSSAELIRKINDWIAIPETVKQLYIENAVSTYNQYFTAEYNFMQLSSIYTSLINEKKSDFQLSN